MATKLNFTKGRPDLPLNEPKKIASGASSNDTDQVYCIDTLGATVTFNAGMLKINDDGTKSASEWASTAVAGVFYGRWTNVGASDGVVAVYTVDVSNSGK